MAIADPIKPTTAAAIRALRAQGLRVVMLTGDNKTTAQAVGRSLEIDDIEAEILPQEKAKVVERLRNQGRIVAMAGDGVNDAPALAAADVGVAMATGTDIAIQSADVTLLRGDLQGIVFRPPAFEGDDGQYPAEPLLRFLLQRHWRAYRRRRSVPGIWSASVSHRRSGRYGAVVGQRHRQCAPSQDRAVGLIFPGSRIHGTKTAAPSKRPARRSARAWLAF